MNNSRKISTRVADISLEDDGIILINIKESADVDEFDVLDLKLITKHLSKNKPALKLVDSRNSWTISSSAKKKAMKEFSDSNTLARAIVVSNHLKLGILSFMKKFESKKFPQKYFTDLNEARKWLLMIRSI